MSESPKSEQELEEVKAALVRSLFERIGLDLREAVEMVDRFYGEIASSFESGESVELAGFGYFSLRDGFSSSNQYQRGEL